MLRSVMKLGFSRVFSASGNIPFFSPVIPGGFGTDPEIGMYAFGLSEHSVSFIQNILNDDAFVSPEREALLQRVMHASMSNFFLVSWIGCVFVRFLS